MMPVAGQEPQPGRGAAGRQLGDHQAGVGDVVEQLTVRRRVGPVDPAGEHGDRRPAHRQRTAVGCLVDAERRAGDDACTPSAASVRADLARHAGAVRRGRARPDHGHGPFAQRRRGGSGPRTQSPSGAPPRRSSGLAPVEVAELRRPLRRRRDRRTGCPAGRARSRSPLGVEAAQPRRRRRAATPASVASRRAGGRRPAARRGRRTSPASRGSPGSPSRLSAARATRSSAAVGRVTSRAAEPGRQRCDRPSSSGTAGAQPQRDVELVRPGPVDAAQVGHRPGQPVHPGARRAGSAGRSRPRSSSRRSAALGQRPPRPQRRAGHVAVEPPVACRGSGPPAAAARRPRRDRAPTRWVSGRASGSVTSCGGTGSTCRVMSIRSAIGPLSLLR